MGVCRRLPCQDWWGSYACWVSKLCAWGISVVCTHAGGGIPLGNNRYAFRGWDGHGEVQASQVLQLLLLLLKKRVQEVRCALWLEMCSCRVG